MPLTSPSVVIQDSLFDIRYSNKHADTRTISLEERRVTCSQRRDIRSANQTS